MSFNWTCPYCNRDQSVTASQFSEQDHYINNRSSILGPVCLYAVTIRCANERCKKLQLAVSLRRAVLNEIGGYVGKADIIRSWQLLPESSAKPQPEYIPKQIVEDYTEACRIRDLSPKASATMSRRCIQGMIRDFCGIKDSSLFKEIDRLRKALDDHEGIRHVHEDTVDALDHVRKIGRIGAHMEKDVNLIIEVEPSEAQTLIELIELLFDEWYTQREQRGQRLRALKEVADQKVAPRSEE